MDILTARRPDIKYNQNSSSLSYSTLPDLISRSKSMTFSNYIGLETIYIFCTNSSPIQHNWAWSSLCCQLLWWSDRSTRVRVSESSGNLFCCPGCSLQQAHPG
ncbi:unnamed protein product [Protopolystoma xenopodis]|uniref:Uncharacterized protein n=1 Tax=Protopolystoma xenopodis TaxID=117903 RepID=A0A3S5BX44_9PLAT|nr:unnamed protein product [Protopolystoma xenopodis]